MIKIGIVGGTGYTGLELLRLLANHQYVQVVVITSRVEAGNLVESIFPNLRGFYPTLKFSHSSTPLLNSCDIVFFATPHGVAHQIAPSLLASGVKIIDLSADFRLKNVEEWEKWYGQPHAAPNVLADAVYGLPEVNRELIKNASLIAVPGCYPTATQLGFLPLLQSKVINLKGLIADCKSGVSGAGRVANVGSLYCEASENVKAYSLTSGHRHLPEICQGLMNAANHTVDLTFVPHLVPMMRGIHATLYAELENVSVNLQQLYVNYYANEPFVDILPEGKYPETRSVYGTNMCRIAVHRLAGSNKVIVLSVIDNLIKGAAGQAVQNMNILLGVDELEGLSAPGVTP
ncbi:UNVERIFIED_CONTAM: hypothetical protein GTU68_022270 [Idotea baltica]|nr:hypothetical protein [Idotea baltica]